MEQEKTMIHDLTQGNLTKQVIRFSLPFMAGNLMSMLYTLVDLAVVGQFTGAAGLSAVSIGGQITMLCNCVGSAYGNGGQIYVAQLVGLHQKKELNSAIGTSASFSLILSVIVAMLAGLMAPIFLGWLNTPIEVFASAKTYLVTCCFGLPFVFLFGTLGDTLRGMGDSKTPFLIMLVATVMNIILDLLFVAGLSWGAFGAAFATVISQLCSAVFAIIYLKKHEAAYCLRFSRDMFRIRKDKLKIITKVSMPLMAMQVFLQLTTLFVNAFINDYGVTASAVTGVGSKLYTIMNVVTMSVNAASASLTGQNLAAGKIDRARKTVWIGLAIDMVMFVICGSGCIFFPKAVFGIFTSDPEVLEMSVGYLRIIVWVFLSFALMSPCLGLINGCGATTLNMVIAIADSVARIALTLIFGKVLHLGLEGFWVGSMLAGYVSVVWALGFFFSGKWKNYRLLDTSAEKNV